MCVFFSKLKVKGHCYGNKDRRYLLPSSPSAGRSISAPRSPTSSARRIIYNRPTAPKPGPTSPLQRLRKLREDSGVLRSMEDALFVTRRRRLLQRSPFSRAANNIDLPSSYLFSVNMAPRLSGLITLKDEGNVSSVTAKPSIGEVIDKGRLSF